MPTRLPLRGLLLLLLLTACSDGPKAATDHDGDGVEDEEDCEPWDSAAAPGLAEVCDGRDNDCDALIDEDDPDLAVQGYTDEDGDGYAGTASHDCDAVLEGAATDCDDADTSAHPGLPEDCDTLADDGCDGLTSETDAENCEPWLRDGDGDGYGAEESICACEGSAPFTTQTGGDCDDADPEANPGDGTCWMRGEVREDDAGGVWYEEAREPDGWFVDGVGQTVAGAGDVNGDGFQDILVGAEGESTLWERAGAVYVIFGPALGTHPVDDADGILLGDRAGVGLGESLSGAGDVDGDGYADVLLGSQSSTEDSGAVARLVFGPAEGARVLDGGDPELVIGSGDSARVAGAGDPDGDGMLDLLLASMGADVGDLEDAGAVYLVQAPLSGVLDVEASARAVLQGERASAYLGVALSTGGDADGDGVPDTWVAGRGYPDPDDADGRVDAAWLFVGPLDGTLTPADAEATFALTSSNGSSALSGVGDLDGDGRADLIVGSSGVFDDRGVSGDVYTKLGPFSGVISAEDADAVIVGLPDAVSSTGCAWTDNLGEDVTSPGDLDGDGTDEVLMTAEGLFNLYYSPVAGVHDPSDAHVRLGTYTRTDEEFEASVDGLYTGSASVAAPGDVDADGTPDLLLGSRAACTYGGDCGCTGEEWPRYNAARVYSGTPG